MHVGTAWQCTKLALVLITTRHPLSLSVEAETQARERQRKMRERKLACQETQSKTEPVE